MKITVKTNGYEAAGIQEMMAKFNKAAEKLFPDCEVRHFYYGDQISMSDIILPDKHYAHFTISAKSVRLGGYTATNEQYRLFGMMTYRDELYKGKLMQIAE